MLLKNAQIAAQMYCFRQYTTTKAGTQEVLHRLREMGYGSIQLSGALSYIPAEELAEMTEKESLSICSTHEGTVDETKIPALIERMKKTGMTHAAIACPPFPNAVTGEYEVIASAEKMNQAARRFAEEGLTLSYHNHAIEFRKFNGKTILEILYEHAPDLEAEIDTHWVWRGGNDPVQWIRRFKGRMQAIHLKDYGVITFDVTNVWNNKPGMTPLGDGNLDWKSIIPEALASGVKWYIVEHDADCPDPFVSFERSIRFLEKL